MASSSEPREVRRPLPGWLLDGLTSMEDLVYLTVALVLIGIAIAGMYNTVDKLIDSNGQEFATVVTNAVNGVLFVVIVLEIFRTVVAHLEGGGFQLRPFLIIGVISAVRHILLVGALSLSNNSTIFNHTEIELGVNAGVALVLVIALVLLHRTGMTSDIDDD
ncbi:MAG TPA: phosphate-starvation-inducible PsiE family protein [Acidimicrobiia bacterium]|nr:phosphate-starvation-inducible PsiE family protein [Acidimicrobiia bacterium]